MSELERLVAEQQADDTAFSRPEPQTVSLESVTDYIGESDTYFAGTEDEDGESDVCSFLPTPKGEVLIEGATWHGTLYGSRNKKCKCAKCAEAGKLYQRKLRARV